MVAKIYQWSHKDSGNPHEKYHLMVLFKRLLIHCIYTYFSFPVLAQ